MIHALKIKKEWFEQLISQNKPYEIRRNDRGYRRGDVLALNEIDDAEKYTGRSKLVVIRAVIDVGELAPPDYVHLTLVSAGICAAPWNLLATEAREAEENE